MFNNYHIFFRCHTQIQDWPYPYPVWYQLYCLLLFLYKVSYYIHRPCNCNSFTPGMNITCSCWSAVLEGIVFYWWKDSLFCCTWFLCYSQVKWWSWIKAYSVAIVPGSKLLSKGNDFDFLRCVWYNRRVSQSLCQSDLNFNCLLQSFKPVQVSAAHCFVALLNYAANVMTNLGND